MNASILKRRIVFGDKAQGEMSDDMLVSAAVTGDRRAFVELCGRHSKKILHTIHRITNNWDDAEDVLQDSLLKVFSHLNTFEGRSTFSSWFTRIAMNSALMFLRTKRRLTISIDSTYDECGGWETRELQDQTGTPESLYEQREREELLRSALLRLPAIFREVIELRLIQEYSTLEIAHVLGISVAAAKSRLSRARLAMVASCSTTAPTRPRQFDGRRPKAKMC